MNCFYLVFFIEEKKKKLFELQFEVSFFIFIFIYIYIFFSFLDLCIAYDRSLVSPDQLIALIRWVFSLGTGDEIVAMITCLGTADIVYISNAPAENRPTPMQLAVRRHEFLTELANVGSCAICDVGVGWPTFRPR